MNIPTSRLFSSLIALCLLAATPAHSQPNIVVEQPVGTPLDGSTSVVAWGSNGQGQTTVPAGLTGVQAIAAGLLHTVALKGDGTVVAWGYNGQGQTTVPAGLTGVQAIAAGGFHTVALKSDGTVVAWGENGEGQTTVPAGLTGVQAIAAGSGSKYTVALKSDGTVVAWGDNEYGQTTVPAGLTGVKAIAAGYYHTVALKSDGTVVAWGNNFYGQRTVPAGLTGVQAIAAGSVHTVALKSDGTVFAWGDNGGGQRTVPAGLTGVKAIAAGDYHTVALKSDGTVVAWGYDYYGQTTVPAGLTGVQAIAAGGSHSVALAGAPSVAFPDQLLTTTSAPRTYTIRNTGSVDLVLGTITVGGAHPGDFTVSAPASSTISAGSSTTFTITFSPGSTGLRSALLSIPSNDGDLPGFLVALGGTGTSNNADLIGLALSAGTLTPVFDTVTTSYTASVNFSSILTVTPTAAQGAAVTVNGTLVVSGSASSTIPLSVGENMIVIVVTSHDGITTKTYTITVTRLGTPEIVVEQPLGLPLRSSSELIAAWGSNGYGQTTVPAGLSGVQAIAAGFNHTVALKSDGTVVAWGYDYYGQATVPAGLTGVQAIAAGVNHTVALKSDGTVVAWGDNSYGQTTTPAGLTGVQAVSAGIYHTVALKSDGTVIVWGDNTYGQRAVPVGLNGVQAVSAGRYHTMALKNDGTVVAWGYNSQGQASVPAGLTGVQAIAASWVHSVALKSDGTVVAWGYNVSGQIAVPAGLTGVQAISSCGQHTLALKSDGTVVAWGLNSSGSTTVPAGVTDVQAIAGGGLHSVALVGLPTIHFADQLVASSTTKTVVIRNNGEAANLTLGTITIDGANAADFTVSAVPGSSTLVPGDSTTFTVTFHPSALGSRHAVLHIPSNDLDEATTHLVLTGAGVNSVPDGGFNASVVGTVTTSALQPDGKLIIGGSFTSVGGVNRNGLARLNADDSLDTNFNPNVTGTVSSLLVLESGQIVIAGSFSSVGGTARGNIARLNEEGTVDGTFNPTANGAISCLALQANDQIVIGGDFTTLKPNGAATATTRNHIARLNGIGTLDTLFNPNANDAVRCVALQPDGSMVVGGDFTLFGTATSRNRIARLTAAGVVDTAFNPGASGGTVASVTVLPDGSLIVAGSFSTIAGSAHQGLAKLSSAGVLDASYNATTNGPVQSVALQANGEVIIGGSFTSAGGSPRNNSARIKADGSVDAGYIPNVLGTGSVVVNSVMIQEDGKVFLGGSFSSVSGLVCGNLVRYVSTAAVQTLAPIGSDIEWQRSGAAAEVVEVAFDLSTDGGETWTLLAAGTRMTSGWTATGVTLTSASGLLRGRARTLSGQNNGSSGWVVFQAPYLLPSAEIVVEQPVNTELTDGADTLAFGTLGLNALKPIVVTIRNVGGQPLTGVVVTINGTNANQFSIIDQPDTTVGALDSTTFTVQAKVTTAGAKTAVLRITSNDANESLFDIDLTASGAPAVLPVVAPKPATNISFTSATINGTVDAKGSPREIFFDVGTAAATYTNSIAATPAALETSGVTTVSADLSGLLPHTKYYFRVRTLGDLGNMNSTELNFTTLNHVPVGVADTGTVVLPSAVATIDVLANDSDDDGDTLTITAKTAVTPTTAGTLAIVGNQLAFTASAGFSGTASFGYTLSDGINTATATVSVSSGGITLDPPAITQPAAGVTYDLNIITTGAWAVSEALAWASVSPTSGVGNSTVQVTLQPNTSKTARPVGVLKIGGVSHTITQSGVLVPTLGQALSGTTVPSIVSGAFSLTIPTVNAPVTYTVTNMPPGLTIDNNTGIISGLPTTAGSKSVVIKATNAAATTAGAAATLSFTINVEALPAGTVGTFHGIVERSSTVNLTPVPDLGARFEMTSTSTGAVTGQVYEGVTKKAFTGQLAATLADPKHPTLLGILTGMSQRLELTLDSDANSLIGLLRDASSSNATPVTAWRNGWQTVAPINKASAYKVQHNFAIENTSSGGPDGFGYGSFIVTENTGALTITGKLPDGSTLLCTTFIGQDGQVLLYQPLHANRGSCFGKLIVTPVNAPTDNTVSGTLSWLKPASLAAAKDTVYSDGFSLDLTVMGSTYIAPLKGQRVLGLPAPAATPVTATNAKLGFTLGGLAPDFDQLIRVANPSTTGLTNTATVAAYNAAGTPNPNPNKVAIITFTAPTGLFAGSYIIPGATTALNRSAPFYGQIVRIFGTTTTTQGYGHFLLPSMPTGAQTVLTSPKLSGSVEFKAP